MERNLLLRTIWGMGVALQGVAAFVAPDAAAAQGFFDPRQQYYIT